MRIKMWGAGLFLAGAAWASGESSIWKLSSTEKIPQDRMVYEIESKKMPQGPPLLQARVAARRENFKLCFSLTAAQFAGSGLLKPWVAVQNLECALGEAANDKVGIEHLQQALARVEPQLEWFLTGPQVSALKTVYVQAHLALAQKAMRVYRPVAQKSLKRLMDLRGWLTKEHLAEVYKLSGELAFLTQNWAQAKDFFTRSLNLHDSEDLRARLVGLQKFLPIERPAETPATGAAGPALVEATSAEEEIYARMQAALKTGDLVAASEDGIKLIENYPGGRRARWAQDRVLESYWTVAQKTDASSLTLRKRILNLMLRADGGRLLDWASNLFQRGNYPDAQELAEHSYAALRGQAESTRALRVAGRAAVLAGDTSSAKKSFELLAREHAGTPEAVEAVFRLGLLHFRQKKYSDALAAFERVKILPGADDYQYLALYWYWRGQQKIQTAQAPATAQQLAARYPLTYYGLRARAELAGNTLQFQNQKLEPFSAQIFLTAGEAEALKRLRALVAIGWYREAQEEVKILPHGRTAREKLLLARYFGAALDDVAAFPLINQALEEEPALLRPDTLLWAFPKEFTRMAQAEANRLHIKDSLVMALIRQESSFKIEATSSAQAFGLMQVLMPTAKEIAQDLNIKSENPKFLFDPANNIRIGSTYLSRLIKTFKGHLPVALAAYNAGMGHLKKFLSARPELANLITQPSSSPEDELWIDELPWPETSYYVKAVLRNYLMYQWLEASRTLEGSRVPVEFRLPHPIWAQ